MHGVVTRSQINRAPGCAIYGGSDRRPQVALVLRACSANLTERIIQSFASLASEGFMREMTEPYTTSIGGDCWRERDASARLIWLAAVLPRRSPR